MPVKGSQGGAGGSAKDIRAGGGYWELFTRDNLTKQLDRIQVRVKAFAAFMSKVGTGGIAAGAGLLAPVAALFKSGVDRAATIQKLADRFGETTERISAMAGAFELAGVELNDFADLAKDATKLNKTNLPLSDYLLAVADSLGKIPDPAKRAEFAVAALGENGIKHLELLGKGSGELASLMDRAPILDAATGRSAVETQRALAEATLVLKDAVLDLAPTVLPVVRALAALAKENAGVVRLAALGGMGLLALGLGAKVAGVGAGVAALGIKGIGLALGFLLSPLGLVTAGVVALGYLWVSQTEEGKAFAAELGETFRGLADTAVTAWQGIVAALQSGDLELAGRVAMAGLKAAWLQAMEFLTRHWVDFKRTVITGWMDLRDLTSKSIIGWRGLITWITDGKEAAKKLVNDEGDMLEAMRKEENREREKNWNKQIDDAKAEVEKAKAELDALAGAAVEAAEKKRMEEELRKHRDMMAGANLVGQTKGGFFSIGGASQSLGFADKIDRQLAVQAKILAVAGKELPEINAGIQKLPDLFKIK